MDDHTEDLLRRLALNDDAAVCGALGAVTIGGALDPRTLALVRLAALVAVDAAAASFCWAVDEALAAGATNGEVVATLLAVAPTVGLARLVSAAPRLALALGYDVDAALEELRIP